VCLFGCSCRLLWLVDQIGRMILCSFVVSFIVFHIVLIICDDSNLRNVVRGGSEHSLTHTGKTLCPLHVLFVLALLVLVGYHGVVAFFFLLPPFIIMGLVCKCSFG
jgi:hypothetical protein